MTWRYRRSRSMGPFRVTATRSGLSLGVGGPLGRVSVNTRGQVRETTRIPGVGIYQTRQVAQLGKPAGAPQPAGVRPQPQGMSAPARPAAAPVGCFSLLTTAFWAVVLWCAVLITFSMQPPTGWRWLALGLATFFSVGLISMASTYRQQHRHHVALPTPPPEPATEQAPAAVGGEQLERTVQEAISAPHGTPPGPAVAVTALDATGGNLALDAQDPLVVTAKLVGLVDPVAKVADLIQLKPTSDGMRHGVHEGVLMPTGAEWHAFCLIHPEDNPSLFTPGDTTVAALHVGRLSVRDVRKYQDLFCAHPVHVALFLEATPGVERIEARFLNKSVEPVEVVGVHEAPTSPSANNPAQATLAAPQHLAPADPRPAVPPRHPLPPPGWYTDPVKVNGLRWWDGLQWTTYTAGGTTPDPGTARP